MFVKIPTHPFTYAIPTLPKIQFPATLIVSRGVIHYLLKQNPTPNTGDFRPCCNTPGDNSRPIPTSLTISGFPSSCRCRTPPPALSQTTTVATPHSHRRDLQTPHYSGTHGGSNDADSNGSHRPFITRKGYKFRRQSIHRAIVKIFWQSINEPWVTYKKTSKEVVTQMFERFRTQYRWDPNEEGLIHEGFENTLKDRYRGRMRDAREASANSARKAGHVITEINDNFEIVANYNPAEIHIDVWRPRHTGGSIRFEEHRLKLKQLTDKEAQVDFVNETSRVAIESYNTSLSKKYGDDPTQHNVNDPELWTQTQLLRKGRKQKGSIYGAGYSDLHFLMTGAYSYESTSASADFAKSQQEVNELRQKISNMEQAMEEKQSEMNLQMQ
ncbi:unnamed protein product [Lactuca saligna]|uniref:Transposase, Ptta/En/Spm, plant n=1 Tax=Lactuca saligna TaxID=75948 RepID=A0AA35YTJ6_LACSI|nr:unnamed protein product [Lactuca saligna]